jgi:hypothetical protein
MQKLDKNDQNYDKISSDYLRFNKRKFLFITVLGILILYYALPGLCNDTRIADNSESESITTKTPGQSKSAAVQELYREEQESWKEYVKRFYNYRLDTSFDINFYHISLDVALDSQYIVGDVQCLFTASQDNLNSVKLNLQDSLTIDSITGNCDSWLHDGDTIRITLDQYYNTDDEVGIRIYYQGKPPIIEGTKGLRYEYHGSSEPIIASLSTPFLAHYWWPCKDGPGDKPDSVYIDITIPDTIINEIPLIAVSNGTLDGISEFGGKRTFQWRERYPIVTYYVMVAISNFVHFQDSYSGPGDENYPLDYYSFNETLDSSMIGVQRVPEVAAVFSELFGPYPFRSEKYGITELGFYGGIENQTNTVQGSMRPGYFGVTIHELCHMWFADMITCVNWHHGWVNEGFATYSEALWLERDAGIAAYHEEMEDLEYYNGGTLYLQDTSDPMNIFVGIIYYKGAWLLHMLRHVLGDEVFFDCLYQYATTPEFMYDHATTEDFQNVCESVSGIDLDWFFQQWVYGEYYPRYYVSAHTRSAPEKNGSNYETFIHLSQFQSSNPQVFTMPLDFRLWYGTGYMVLQEWNTERIQDISFSTTFEPDSIEFDPFNWVLDEHYEQPYTLHIINDSLADGAQAEIYEDTITVVCATDEYLVEIVSGDLPAGWNLDPHTGVISGISYADTGSFTFMVYATDFNIPGYNDIKTYTVTVEAGGHGPGDANADGAVNVGDAVFVINYVFRGGQPPPYPNWADVNADCSINVADAVYLINFIFREGPEPLPGCVD